MIKLLRLTIYLTVIYGSFLGIKTFWNKVKASYEKDLVTFKSSFICMASSSVIKLDAKMMRDISFVDWAFGNFRIIYFPSAISQLADQCQV